MAWTNETPLTTAVQGLAAVTADAPSGAAGYSIYAIGGSDGTNPVPDVEAYDTGTQTWTTVPPMLTSRLNLAAASGPGRVYALGGSTGAAPLDNNEIYNPAGNDWTAGAALLTARESLGATIGLDGLVYAIGGYDGSYLSTVEAYDPATDTWASRPGMPTARSGLAVAAGPDGLIYAIGGQDATGALTAVEAFDPSTDTWHAKTPLPSACSALAAAVGPDGLIYAFGGLDNNGIPLNTVYAYSAATATWSVQAPMLTQQAFLAGATGPDGLIYALGGQNFVASSLNTVEALTTATPQTAPDPYIGNGGYQSPDIVLLDATNTPVPIGGAPGGAWDTLLVPNTNYGLQALVYNDSSVPAVGTVVGFWSIPGGVAASGTLIDEQTVTVPANGSIVVTSASPFQSGPPLAHECAAVSIYCPTSPYFDVKPTTATQVLNPTTPYPADSGHYGSAWRNTNSYAMHGGMRWVFPYHVSSLREPFTVGLAATAAKVPAGFDDHESVTALRRTLEFAGAADRVPMFLIPELRAKLPEADLGLRLHTKGIHGDRDEERPRAQRSLAVPAGGTGAFYVSGTVPADAQQGDIFLVTVEARYPGDKSEPERVVDYLEVIYVK